MKTCTVCGQPINDDDTSASALELIDHERARQIEVKDFTPEHDDQHIESELAAAALFYTDPFPGKPLRNPWPWVGDKPDREKHTRIHQLVIAGALIVAEIERLQRLANRNEASG